MTATLHTASGMHRIDLNIADTFITRFVGLMFAPALAQGAGLLLTRCTSVHTMFMRQVIDVVYLDTAGCVLQCVPHLKPWRGSFSRNTYEKRRAAHALELAAGSVARFDIRPGDRLELPSWHRVTGSSEPSGHEGSHVRTQGAVPPAGVLRRSTVRQVPNAQSGAAMVEFAVVGPIITLLGLATLQYGMLFFAKNHINHASFMAARAGAMGNASLTKVRNAYIGALVPLYGGGRNAAELAESQAKAAADVGSSVRIELLNPTAQSFTDWNDQTLQNTIGNGKRVIPNASLASKNLSEIRPNSSQNITDANLIKLRITHGYEPKVPLMKLVYGTFLRWLDNGTDPFQTALIQAGRIPVVTHVTLQMQSDAIEGDTVSMPAQGDGGGSNPGDNNPPNCQTAGCTVPNPPADPGGSGGSGDTTTPADPGGGGDGGGSACSGENCPVCTGTVPTLPTTLPADVLFAFGSSTLTAEGKAELDKYIASVKDDKSITSATVTGYTDPLATPGFDNNALSLARAQAVRDYLVNNGFPNVPIEVKGLGASNLTVPLEACPQSGQEQINCLAPDRRVVVELHNASTQ